MTVERRVKVLPTGQWMVETPPPEAGAGPSATPGNEAAAPTATGTSQLRRLLREFIHEALAYLRQWSEWPRRPGDDLNLHRSAMWLAHADQVPSLGVVRAHLQEEPLRTLLRNTGHQWIWHYEYLPELFLEQVGRRSLGQEEIPAGIFAATCRDLERELAAGQIRLRRVTAVHGVPAPRRRLDIASGVYLVPYDVTTGPGPLSDLLWLKYQRDVRRHVPAIGVLLVQERVVAKADEGKPLLSALDQLRDEGDTVVGALRLAYGGGVHISASWVVQLSRFPLVPAVHRGDEESPETWHEAGGPGGPRDARRLREAHALLTHPQRSQERQRLRTAFRRYEQAFRLRRPLQNVIDLVVALEGLYGVRRGELKRRLAQRVALLLAEDGGDAQAVYDQIAAAYDIRSALVHGRSTEEKLQERLASAVKAITGLGELQAGDEYEQAAYQAMQRIRELTRSSLWAFARLQGFLGGAQRWPKDDEEWDRLVFDHGLRRSLRRAAGL